MSADAKRPCVVILGGGFGGLYAAKELRRAPVSITLLDRKNHHTFQPLLYQVASAALSPGEIAVPIRNVLRKQKNARVLLAEATGIDLAGRRVLLDGGSVSYDHLIIATGATHSYFGHDEWAAFAPGLKTIEDALEIRRRVLLAYEAAEREDDPARQAQLLTFVVIGGGPTGVELAGALAEISRRTLAGDFRRIDPASARVILLEGADRILLAYTPELSEKARRQLVRLGVEVRTDAKVTGIDADGVTVGPDRIPTRTALWAAGVRASSLARSLGVPLDRAGRVLVEPDLGVRGHPGVYVIGDLAAITQDGKPVPGVAGAAIQGGRQTARNIERAIAGRQTVPFRYKDKGSLATVGRAAAVADFGRVKLSGFVAWLAWVVIHVLLLIGFRNRFVVTFLWAWSYVTHSRGARLITGTLSLPSARGAAPPAGPASARPPRPPAAPPVGDGAEPPAAP